jgi:hypothetical protein
MLDAVERKPPEERTQEEAVVVARRTEKQGGSAMSLKLAEVCAWGGSEAEEHLVRRAQAR